MAVRNDSEREIIEYLQFLLDHAVACEVADCSLCSTLHNICDNASGRLFSIEHFPQARQAGRLRRFQRLSA